MRILGFAEVDAAAMSAQDEGAAHEFDARRAEIERIARPG